MPRQSIGTNFHAIDTSNVMDYVGVWNLVLACTPCLREPLVYEEGVVFEPFIFTEQILGVASRLDDMLTETLPYDPVSRLRSRNCALHTSRHVHCSVGRQPSIGITA